MSMMRCPLRVLFVRCCLLCVVWCVFVNWLFMVVCCSFVDCCLLRVTRCVPFVVYGLSFVGWRSLFARGCLLMVVCFRLAVVGCRL